MTIQASYFLSDETMTYVKNGNPETATIENPQNPSIRVDGVRLRVFAGRGTDLIVQTADGREFICQVPYDELKEEGKEEDALPPEQLALGRYTGPIQSPPVLPRCYRSRNFCAKLGSKAAQAAKSVKSAVCHYGPPVLRAAGKAGVDGSKALLKAAHSTFKAVGVVSGEVIERTGEKAVENVRWLKENCPALLGASVAAVSYYAYQGSK